MVITDTLPATGFIRICQIVGSKKHGIPAIYPVSRSTLYEHVKAGRFPQPIKVGPKLPMWRVEEVREHLKTVGLI